MVIPLMPVGGYFIDGYWWLLVNILLLILVFINDYYINGYWWLFYWCFLMIIILMAIGAY
jgi:hypothetical protein